MCLNPVDVVGQVVVSHDELHVIGGGVDQGPYPLLNTSAPVFVARIGAEVLARRIDHKQLWQERVAVR